MRRVFPSEVAGGQHSGQEHRQAAFGECGKQPVQVRACNRRVDRPQGVVGPQRDDHRVGTIGERPFEPGESAGGGVTRNAGVDDACIDAALAQRRLQAGGQGVARSEPVARGEAVAEHDDAKRFGAGLRCESGRGQSEAQRQPHPRDTRNATERPQTRRRLVPLRARALGASSESSCPADHRIH